MKILIVDDNLTNVEILQAFVSPFGTSTAVLDGQTALKHFEEAIDKYDPFDLVCLDIMMPGRDGQQILKMMRKIEADKGLSGKRQTRIIMVSAAPVADNMLKAFSAQCDAYLSKPVNRNDLLKQLYILELVDADEMVKVLLNIK